MFVKLKSAIKYGASFLSGIFLTLIVIHLLVQYFIAGYILNTVNQNLPELTKRKIEIEDLKISFLSGRVDLYGLIIESTDTSLNTPLVIIEKTTLKFSLSELLKNNLKIESLNFKNAILNSDTEDFSSEGLFLVYLSLFQKLKLMPESITVKNSVIVGKSRAGSVMTILDDLNISASGITKDISKSNPACIKISAKIPSKKKGSLKAEFIFVSWGKNYSFDGEFKVKNAKIGYLYKLLGESEDSLIEDGDLEIKTTVKCTDNWVTASNIVSIENLKFKTDEKKIFGISSDLVSEFFLNSTVSFDLPVSGNINHLTFDFTTSVTQVMMKALEGRFSRGFRRKISESVGNKIGKKLDKIFTKLLYHKK